MADVHPTAIVSSKATLGEGVVIGPYSMVGADVVLVYRLLKLDLGTKRHVVATDRASRQIEWPLLLKTNHFDEVVSEFGNTLLCVTTVPNSIELYEAQPSTKTKISRVPGGRKEMGLGVTRAKKGKVAA